MKRREREKGDIITEKWRKRGNEEERGRKKTSRETLKGERISRKGVRTTEKKCKER